VPRAALLVALAAPLAIALACTRAADPPAPSDMPQAPPVGLDTYPLNRLVFAHNPVEPLDHPLAADVLKASKVRSYRAFTATTPRVWLLAFEFDKQSDLLDLAADPSPLVGAAPPYYTATAFTGAWLLVTGFPGEKPVSPEMEAARTTFLARWAGEE
jgi:hypothetical protein